MHFTRLLLTATLAIATPNPQSRIEDLVDDITDIAHSAADWGGDFATNIYNEATSLVNAVQAGDTYSSMVSRANDVASAWHTGTSKTATQTRDTAYPTATTDESETSHA